MAEHSDGYESDDWSNARGADIDRVPFVAPAEAAEPEDGVLIE